jgi:hypothetical protein
MKSNTPSGGSRFPGASGMDQDPLDAQRALGPSLQRLADRLLRAGPRPSGPVRSTNHRKRNGLGPPRQGLVGRIVVRQGSFPEPCLSPRCTRAAGHPGRHKVSRP